MSARPARRAAAAGNVRECVSWRALPVPSTLLALPDDARVDRGSIACDGVKVQLVAAHFHQHETPILVERGGGCGGGHDAALALTARAGDEIGDALLRVQTFVDVVVARERHVDSMPDQNRLEDHA